MKTIRKAIKVRYSKKECSKLKSIVIPDYGSVVIVGDFHFRDPKRTYRLAILNSGNYEVNNRLSNHWYWTDINSDGTLGAANSGYGNFYIPPEQYQIITTVQVI